MGIGIKIVDLYPFFHKKGYSVNVPQKQDGI